MDYLNIEECCSKIEDSRIDRENSANVYVMADDKRMLVSFAYSDKVNDEIILVDVQNYNKEHSKEIWLEYLTLSMLIETKYKVRRFVDDVRTTEEEE